MTLLCKIAVQSTHPSCCTQTAKLHRNEIPTAIETQLTYRHCTSCLAKRKMIPAKFPAPPPGAGPWKLRALTSKFPSAPSFTDTQALSSARTKESLAPFCLKFPPLVAGIPPFAADGSLNGIREVRACVRLVAELVRVQGDPRKSHGFRYQTETPPTRPLSIRSPTLANASPAVLVEAAQCP
jgi:hypothetical protein